MLLINHTQKMTNDKLISPSDYNYPLVNFYRYANKATLRGAEKSRGMAVEYAVRLRVEFIPEGCDSGPVKQMYFKIFKRGTCGIVGAVIGWPSLDHPAVPGGEGLSWVNRPDGAEFKTLGVVLPRTDDGRKEAYLTKSAI